MCCCCTWRQVAAIARNQRGRISWVCGNMPARSQAVGANGPVTTPGVESSMSPTSGNPRQNHLLNAIPEAEWERFAINLAPVPLRLGDVIYESGSEQPYVYFPT